MFKRYWQKFISWLKTSKPSKPKSTASSEEYFTAIVHSVDDLLNLKGWMYFIPFRKLSAHPLEDHDITLAAGFYPCDGLTQKDIGQKVDRTLWQLKDANDVVIARIVTLAVHDPRIFKIVQMRFPDAEVNTKVKADHA